MKQDYESAKLEIIMFEAEDIVTVSGNHGNGGSYEGGEDPGGWI